MTLYYDDGDINFLDLGALKAVFFTTDADGDFNGDGAVNFLDLAIMKAMFFGPAGPSCAYPNVPWCKCAGRSLTVSAASRNSSH